MPAATAAAPSISFRSPITRQRLGSTSSADAASNSPSGTGFRCLGTARVTAGNDAIQQSGRLERRKFGLCRVSQSVTPHAAKLCR